MKWIEDESRVSVVIPAYNAAIFLDESLDLVLAQSETETGVEVWVIDDGPTKKLLIIEKSQNICT